MVEQVSFSVLIIYSLMSSSVVSGENLDAKIIAWRFFFGAALREPEELLPIILGLVFGLFILYGRVFGTVLSRVGLTCKGVLADMLSISR